MGLAESSPATISGRSLHPFAAGGTDGTVVWVRGEQDFSTVAALSETLAGAIALNDADLIVDLSAVEFMDAATVGVIIRARNFLRLRSRSLAVRAPSECAQRILDLCGLAAPLGVHPGDITPITGRAGALATWVAVPATDPRDGRADPFPAERRNQPVPVTARRLDGPSRSAP